MEWDTDAYEMDGTEDNIDFSISNDENEKHSGTPNIPLPSVGKSIKVLFFILKHKSGRLSVISTRNWKAERIKSYVANHRCF